MFDQKEDLRLRMADLERKLAESEEERSKLEKTCNVLMKAFREEEKMQYKALNQKYEKFLEDCTLRKRRNNIILRSLCRIEDRSRALFAKTERLKLLKDRYVSYVNISDYKERESWRSLPVSSSQQKITTDAAPKYAQWTTPLAGHLKREHLRESARDVLGGSRNTGGERNVQPRPDQVKSEEKQGRYEMRRPNYVSLLSGRSNIDANTSRVQDRVQPGETVYGSYNTDPHTDRKKIVESEKPEWSGTKSGNYISDEFVVKEKEVVGRESVEKPKKGLLPSETGQFTRGKDDGRLEPVDRKVRGNAEVDNDPITKQNKPSIDGPFPRSRYNWTHDPNVITRDEEKQEEESEEREWEVNTNAHPDDQEDNIPSRGSPDSKSLPKGLDGVDYQDETYPESYYEQPVHHNHTSIASDVILEEDETEQELEEEEKNQTPADSFRQESQPREDGTTEGERHGDPRWEADEQEKEEADDPNEGRGDEVKSESESGGKKQEEKESDKSEESEKVGGTTAEKSEKKTTGPKSNLIHLLESDSESFQIEHGDAVSGNEDTDFDFSFHQN